MFTTTKWQKYDDANEKKWNMKIKKRERELMKMENTNRFISKSKLTTKGKIYNIHDNGGRTFRVTCNRDGIDIHKAIGLDIDEFTILYGKVFKHITDFEGYWSGFDSSV